MHVEPAAHRPLMQVPNDGVPLGQVPIVGFVRSKVFIRSEPPLVRRQQALLMH